MRRAMRLIAILAATSLVVGVALDENGQARQGSSASEARGAYWLGESFRGLPLTATPGSGYIYGDCDPGPDSGCAPPLEVQNSSACTRNPVGLDVAPARIRLLRGGAVAAAYPGNGVDVGTGRHTVTVFADSDAVAWEAAPELRRRAATGSPARYSPPVYPPAVLRELKRVVVARKRVHSIGAVSRGIGLPRGAVRSRLRLARLLEPALADVRAPTRSWKAVERDRQVAFEARELGEARTARRLGISRAQLSRVILRVRGLTGDC